MSTVDKAYATQLANIEKRTGKSLDALAAVIKKSRLEKHGELVAMLRKDLGLGHGDANTLVHHVLKSAGPEAVAGGPGGDVSIDAIVAGYYAGPKAGLRPIHDTVMAAISKFGAFETAPKKTYLSLRRKKQFAMVGPATNTRVEVGLNIKDEVGLNMKDIAGTSRLETLPPGGMCQYKVKLTDAKEVDRELISWIRTAFDQAG